MSYRPSNFIPAAELLEIFPEALGEGIILEKIAEWRERETKITRIIEQSSILIESRNLDPFSAWFWKMCLVMPAGEELLEVRNHIDRLKKLLAVSEGCDLVPRGSISAETIEQARSVPIQDLINQSMRKSGRTLIGLCPFHKEKSPSFYIYLGTNSFYCFGCHAGGDIIEFLRLRQGFSFREAVSFLNDKNEQSS